MLNGVKNTTDDWSWKMVATSDGDSDARVYEVDLDQPLPQEESRLLSAGKAFVDGMAKAGYPADLYGVLVDGVRIQFVFRMAETTFAGKLSDMESAVSDKLLGISVKTASSPRLWDLDGQEARFFSPAGGIAPLYTNRGGKVSTTKAAVDPNPKQLLVGDVQHLTQAKTLPTSAIPGVPALVGDTMSPWIHVAGAAILCVGTYLAIKPSFEMRANGSRRRKR